MTQPVSVGHHGSVQAGPRSVLIAYAKPETGPKAAFDDAKNQLLIADRDREGGPLICDVISITSSPRIAATRNMLVEAFFRHPAEPEWLLMFDDDMVFHLDIVERLLEAADPVSRPIVSGLYFGGRIHGRQVPHAYLLNEAGDGFHPIEGVKGGWGPVAQVHAVGAGCLLMHRSALTTIGDRFSHTGFPWFAEGATNGKEYGEDIVFCLRALDCSIPIFCHTGVICGHVKPGIIDEQTYAEYQAQRDVYGDAAVVRRYYERLRLPVVDTRDLPADNPTPLPPEPFDLPPSEVPVP